MGLGTRRKRKRRRDAKRRIQRRQQQERFREKVVKVATCELERGHHWVKADLHGRPTAGTVPGRKWEWCCTQCPARRPNDEAK